jgi:hypothetical protein
MRSYPACSFVQTREVRLRLVEADVWPLPLEISKSGAKRRAAICSAILVANIQHACAWNMRYVAASYFLSIV